MKKLVLSALLLLGCSGHPCEGGGPAVASTYRPSATWEVHFSPKGGCTDMVVGLIDGSKHTVRVLAYSFTLQPVGDALIRAQGRGVDVQVVVDSGDLTNTSKTEVQALVDAKIPVFSDSKHAIAHNKVIIADTLKVETGSFNYSSAAENSNAENCIVLTNGTLATTYTDNWTLHQGHSTPLQ